MVARSGARSLAKPSLRKRITDKIKSALFSTQGLPIILTFAVIGILFVLFRMKGVELDYKMTEVNKRIEKVTLENKELKAKKARLLSIKRLRRLAKKYSLSQPKENQIIVIP